MFFFALTAKMGRDFGAEKSLFAESAKRSHILLTG
jgi:hypothetical protein